MSDQLNHLLEVARRWAEFAETLPLLTHEDEELLQAITDYDAEKG